MSILQQDDYTSAISDLAYQTTLDDWHETGPARLEKSFCASRLSDAADQDRDIHIAQHRGIAATDWLAEALATGLRGEGDIHDIDAAWCEVREANEQTADADPDGYQFRAAVLSFLADRELDRRTAWSNRKPHAPPRPRQPRDPNEPQPFDWMPGIIAQNNTLHRAMMARIGADARRRDREEFPADLLRVEGLLGEFVAECERSAPERRQPVYALAAAICVVGALAGRRYRSNTDLRTNVYTAILGESSSGKGHPQRVASRLLREAGLSRYLCGDYQSGAALDAELVRHPALLSIVDEFGIWLAGLTAQRAPKYLTDIRKRLMTLFSSASDCFIGNSYADPALRKRKDVLQPNLCFLGAGTPDHFFNALQSGALKDGFIPRFLVFKPDDYYPQLVQNPQPVEISPAMIRAAQQIADADPESGDLAGLITMQHDIEQPAALVPFTADGMTEHDSQRRRRENIIQAGCVGFVSRELVGKWSEHAIKMAMIRAISRDPANPLMDEVCVRWGWRVAEWCIRTVNAMAERHIADSPQEASHKYLRNVIADAGGAGITKRDLIRRTTRLDVKTREQILVALIEAGEVSAEKIEPGPSGGRPGFRYTFTG